MAYQVDAPVCQVGFPLSQPQLFQLEKLEIAGTIKRATPIPPPQYKTGAWEPEKKGFVGQQQSLPGDKVKKAVKKMFLQTVAVLQAACQIQARSTT